MCREEGLMTELREMLAPVCLFVCLVSKRPYQQLGCFAHGSID